MLSGLLGQVGVADWQATSAFPFDGKPLLIKVIASGKWQQQLARCTLELAFNRKPLTTCCRIQAVDSSLCVVMELSAASPSRRFFVQNRPRSNSFAVIGSESSGSTSGQRVSTRNINYAGIHTYNMDACSIYIYEFIHPSMFICV
ncbi:uncharacterized protein LOC111598624 [Drosophila hydei]|uniref:Uncharacterized protein LOC111598624 n=1 Tax=Drosophila hydei TaxID=7224 RepID=A0A6J1LZX5_DROHY|nr:uncharacterized protein LOC111598624 [Drosophila hydei]